jgi:uncharacterized membrane protein YhhN
MTEIYICLAVFFIVMCIYLYHIIFRENTHEKITKTATSVMFFITGVLSMVLTRSFSFSSIFMCIGLFFSIFGDFFLIKQLKIKHSFMIGVSFFLLAQISYITAFTSVIPLKWFDFAVFGIIEGSALLVYRLMNFDAKSLKLPLLIYSSSLCFMAIKAVSFIFVRPFGIYHALVVATGGILFLISDAILGYSIFSNRNSLKARLTNLLTYYFGQILLAFSIFLMFMQY